LELLAKIDGVSAGQADAVTLSISTSGGPLLVWASSNCGTDPAFSFPGVGSAHFAVQVTLDHGQVLGSTDSSSPAGAFLSVPTGIHQVVVTIINADALIPVIAFVVAEAARFDLVRNTVDAILDVAPRYFNNLNWDYFLPLLQDWRKMSMKYHGVGLFAGITVDEMINYCLFSRLDLFGPITETIILILAKLVAVLSRKGKLY
jgi:hypothetical protein